VQEPVAPYSRKNRGKSSLIDHDEDLKSIPNQELFDPDDLVWDRSSLIDAAASQVMNQIGALTGGELVTERIWLERMNTVNVKHGYLEEGTLDWVIYLRSPGLRVTKAITTTYQVYQGKLDDAKYFRTPSGKVVPLTREHLMNYIQFGIT